MTVVLIVLAAIGIDLSAEHAAQRSVTRVAVAAADDAAGMLDARRLQEDGVLVIDRDAATRVVQAHVATAQLPGILEHLDVVVDDATVDVALRVRVRHLFLGVLPGSDGTATVPVHVRARLDR
jgi:hypothetical protein